MKKFYYNVMFHLTDHIMGWKPNDREHWECWWEVSEYYRFKRNAL